MTFKFEGGGAEAHIGNAPGNYGLGAATAVRSIKLTAGEKTGWFAGLEYRYFGKRPLTEERALWSLARASSTHAWGIDLSTA